MSSSRAAPATSDAGVVDLDEALRPRVSPHQRAMQAGAVLLVVAAIVALLLHGIGPSPSGTASVFSTPTPAPPTVIIMSSVNFGTVTVNGQRLKGAPPLVTRAIHQGNNVVTLNAPPFRSRTCHFLYPNDQPSSEPGCSGDSISGSPMDVNGVSVTASTILSVDLSSTDLPPDLAASAYSAGVQAASAIRPHAVVPAGQYYATGLDAQGHITSRRAAAPVQADLLFGAVDPQSAVSPSFCGPSQFCIIPLDPSLALPASPHVWSVGLALTARWRFTPPVGQPIVTPMEPLNIPIEILLAYDGSGNWSVVMQSSNVAGQRELPIMPLPDELVSSLCDAGTNVVTTLVQQTQQQNGYGFGTSHDQGIEGCEMQLLGSDGTTVQGTFLWRFGVLLAVDKGARTLAPWAPIAPQAEIAAVGG
jgi:hypothetical protein